MKKNLLMISLPIIMSLYSSTIHADDSKLPPIKKWANSSKEIAAKVDKAMTDLNMSIRELEDMSDKIKSKVDQSAIAELDKKLDAVRKTASEIEKQTSELKNSGKMMKHKAEEKKDEKK